MIVENYLCLLFSVVYFLLLIYFRKQISVAFLAQSFIYFLSSIIAVKSSDIFYALIALEFLSIAGVFMIAYSGCIKTAVQYGAINFLSGAMILAAISDMGWHNDIGRLILLFGIMLHCSLLPVSATFVKAYSKGVGSVFLQTFSTKVALVVLYKAFSGEELLSYVAIATVIYSIIYSFKERDIFKLVAYNAIGQVGLMSLAISYGCNVLYYIMPSVLCQTLLYVIAFEIQSESKIRSKSLLISLLFVVLSMSSFPLTFSFGAKSAMLHAIDNLYVESFFVLSSFIFVLTTPLKILLISKRSLIQQLNMSKRFALGVFWVLLLLPVGFKEYSIASILIQVLFLLATVALSILLKNKHFKSIKYDIDYIYNDFLIYIFLLVRKFLSSAKTVIVNAVKFEKSVFLKYHYILQDEAIEYTSFIAVGIVGLFLMINFFI